MNTALVIMAAGMGSRYGGIKQIEPVGPSGEIILDYSIYDALEAGFDKVVFIIRKDIEEAFREAIGDRIEKRVKVEYVFQNMEDLPAGYTVPQGRTKPWGTGQAILACKDVVNEPFAVINADDYYDKGGLRRFMSTSVILIRLTGGLISAWQALRWETHLARTERLQEESVRSRTAFLPRLWRQRKSERAITVLLHRTEMFRLISLCP